MTKILRLLIFISALVLATFFCVRHIPRFFDFNGTQIQDSDCDGYADPIAGIPEGVCRLIIASGAKRRLSRRSLNCNADGSYDGSDSDSLSKAAFRGGFQTDEQRNGIGDACDDLTATAS